MRLQCSLFNIKLKMEIELGSSHPNTFVCRLANENTMKEVGQKMREIHKENDELAARLSKKERECEIKTEEKEELMTTLNKIAPTARAMPISSPRIRAVRMIASTLIAGPE